MSGTSSQSPSAPKRLRPRVRPGQALAIAIVAVAVILQNRERVSIDLFTIDVSAPIWLVLTIMVLLGMAVGALLHARR